MRAGVGAAIMAAALVAATPAASQTSPLGQSGAWTAFGGRSDRGTPMCGMSARGPDRSFYIKYFQGNPQLTIQLLRRGWQIPQRRSIPVRLGVPNAGGWRATAIGGGQLVEFTIPRDEVPRFERLFRGGSAMQVEFLQGNEAPWRLDLSGSSTVADTFLQCIRRLNQGAADGPTQPFDAPGGSTQPFEGGPGPEVPSQPFGGGGTPDAAPAPPGNRKVP